MARPAKAIGPVREPVLGKAFVGAIVTAAGTTLAPSTPDCVVGTTTVVDTAVVDAAVVGAAVEGAAVVGAAVVAATEVGAAVLRAVVAGGAHDSTGRFTVAEFGAVSPLDHVATSETGKLASDSERPDAVPLTAFVAGMTVPLVSPENWMPDGVVIEVNASVWEASSLVMVSVACQL
jgi:hypothetical protein